MMAAPGMEDVDLVVDATGLGRPVVEAMEEAGLSPIPVVITGGVNEIHAPGEWSWRLPKKNLVTTLQILLSRKILHLPPNHALAAAMQNEMRTFKRKQNPNTMHDSFEAGRELEHDDLVFALGLASWHVTKYYLPIERSLSAVLNQSNWREKALQQEFEDMTRRMAIGKEQADLEDWLNKPEESW